MSRSLLVAPLLVTMLLAGPVASASGATQYVDDASSRTTSPCSEATPCKYDYVLNDAGSNFGDTVIVEPGTYDLDANPVSIGKRLDVRGRPGAPRPLFRRTLGGAVPFEVLNTAAGTNLQHLAFESIGNRAIVAKTSTEIADVDVEASDGCIAAEGGSLSITSSRLEDTGGPANGECLLVPAAARAVTLRNVEIESSDPVGAPALLRPDGAVRVDGLKVAAPADGVNVQRASSAETTLRRLDVRAGNVGVQTHPGTLITDSRVIARGYTAIVLRNSTLRNVTVFGTAPGSDGVTLTAENLPSIIQNSILDGTDQDIFLQQGGAGQTKLTVSYSNFDSISGTPVASTRNSKADPRLDAQLRPLAGSPVIDGGRAHPENGPLDLAGRARQIGRAPDMGAFEYSPPRSPGAPPRGAPSPDRLAPVLDAVTASPRSVKRRGRITFSFVSSEAGTATLTVSRRGTGRRVRGRCVKLTKRNRRRPQCKRFATVGRPITKAVRHGPNTISYKPRKTGTWRARLIVADAAGNKSPAKTVRFRVKR